jgi:hypothetical protein
VQKDGSISPWVIACGKDYLFWWNEKPGKPRLFPEAHGDGDVDMGGVEQAAKSSAIIDAMEQNPNGKRERTEAGDDAADEPPLKQQRPDELELSRVPEELLAEYYVYRFS